MNKRVIVVGLGNPLMADEGIGNLLVERLATYTANDRQGLKFIDGGTGGMNLVHLIAGYDKAVIIDCARMGLTPGSIRRFMPEDVESVKKLTHLSLHECDILKVIDISKQLDQCPDEIVIFGIEPETVELKQKLNETVASQIDIYTELISKEL